LIVLAIQVGRYCLAGSEINTQNRKIKLALRIATALKRIGFAAAHVFLLKTGNQGRLEANLMWDNSWCRVSSSCPVDIDRFGSTRPG
jgi:hypothetical protein